METPKVLLIDDEVTFIGNISKMLTYRGYEVKTAGSGEDGLKTLLESSFDVVVLDLRMPGISGMDVLKTIKRNVIDSPEVIILTGFATVDSAIAGLHNGAYDYATKPISIKELAERIAAAYKRKAMRHPLVSG